MAALKNIIKNRLPFSARETAKFVYELKSRRKPPFEGTYQSFADVPAGHGYNDSAWEEKTKKAALRNKSRIGQIIPESDSFSKSLLPAIVSMLGKKEISVLDFGGAAGLDFANLLAQTGNALDIKYHVVDVPSACKAGRDVWKNDARISFTETLPENQKFDIVYSYSALQYVENYQELLKKFAACQPQAMLFCKHPAHENPPFVRLQSEIKTPQWVFSINELKDVMARHGYNLTFRSWGETSYNVDNYQAPYKAPRTANLLFIRA